MVELGEGSEEESLLGIGIVNEQKEEITRLKAEAKIRDRNIRGWQETCENWGIMYERARDIKLQLEAKLDRKDDEVGELEAELEIANAKLADKERVFQQWLIGRINTMAFAQGQLQSSDTGKMGMWMYITSIVSQYRFAEKGVSVSVDIPMDMMLSAEKAVPCGWIINELVSNAFKHAFPDGRKGEVIVAMSKGSTLLAQKGGYSPIIELIVSDNGIGLPYDFKLSDSESLGMTIVKSLTEQLDGEYNLDTYCGHGTKFTIRFEI